MYEFYGVTITKEELRKAFESPDSFARFYDYLVNVYKEYVKRQVLLKAIIDGLISIEDADDYDL